MSQSNRVVVYANHPIPLLTIWLHVLLIDIYSYAKYCTIIVIILIIIFESVVFLHLNLFLCLCVWVGVVVNESQRWGAEQLNVSHGGGETGGGDRQVYAGRGFKGAGVCGNMEEVRRRGQRGCGQLRMLTRSRWSCWEYRSDVVYD